MQVVYVSAEGNDLRKKEFKTESIVNSGCLV